LDRNTGEIVWQWRARKPKTGGYVSLLVLDGHRLIASVNGYTYCLNAATGDELWFNELIGFGSGVASIAAVGTQNPHDPLLAAADADAAAQAAGATAV
jgi:outer membrane protein assembly factor BamB